MKKLTAIIPDTVDPAILAGLLAIASEFRLDSMDGVMPADKAARTNLRIPGRSTVSTIMKHYTPEGVFLKTVAAKWLEAYHYIGAGVNPALGKLTKKGYVRALGSGKYQFVKPLEDGKLAV